MGQQYPYSTIWEKNIVGIVRIYGARAIFLLFCDHQDTGSKSREIEIGVVGPISTHKIFKCLMVKLYPYSTIWEQNIVVFLHIYVVRANFLLFCDQSRSSSRWDFHFHSYVLTIYVRLY